MTARRFNASCPDCSHWRCQCDAAQGDADYSPVPYVRGTPAAPVRAVPPPPAVRDRLAQLRAEFAGQGGQRQASVSAFFGLAAYPEREKHQRRSTQAKS